MFVFVMSGVGCTATAVGPQNESRFPNPKPATKNVPQQMLIFWQHAFVVKFVCQVSSVWCLLVAVACDSVVRGPGDVRCSGPAVGSQNRSRFPAQKPATKRCTPTVGVQSNVAGFCPGMRSLFLDRFWEHELGHFRCCYRACITHGLGLWPCRGPSRQLACVQLVCRLFLAGFAKAAFCSRGPVPC